ncbi:unnamed protein product [Calypogeia fissa]
METSQGDGSKPGGADDSGLLVLGSDLVVDASMFLTSSTASTSGSQSATEKSSMEDYSDLDELQFLRLEGVDRQQRRIVRIVGKFLPATVVNGKRLQQYVTQKLTDGIQSDDFCIVYFHTTVDRGENSPGMLTLRRIYEDLPQDLRQRLGAIYVVHPGIRSRLVLATLGRFFLSDGFYSKLKYVSRVEFLWDYVKKNGQVEVPEFVHEHDQDLENRPLMDYGFEADPYAYAGSPGIGVTSLHQRTFS